MKSVALLGLLALAACASNTKPAASPAPMQPETDPAVTAEEAPVDERSAAEKWAEAKMKDERPTRGSAKAHESLDPLAIADESTIPKMEITPKAELRGKSRGDLDAAVALVKTASTVEEATKKLTQRLGKPTWTENGKRRIWVANDGPRCHRLTLDSDGEVAVETSSQSETSVLSASAKQNLCTGEIIRGVH